MNLQTAGALLIAVLVGAGIWYAKCPEELRRPLSEMHLIESAEATSLVIVKRVSWSQDGRKLLTLAFGDVGSDGPLVLHDLEDHSPRMPIEFSAEPVHTALLAADGRHVVVASYDRTLWWIGLESDERRALLELPPGAGILDAALSLDGRQLAAASTAGSIYLGDPENWLGTVIASGLTSRVSELRFSRDGRRLICAAQDGALCVWDLQSGTDPQCWKAHAGPAMAAAFLTDERIISAGLDDTIRVWSAPAGREIWRGDFGLSGIRALALSSDEKLAAWGGGQRRIIVWDLENVCKKYEIPIPASLVCDIQFSPDSKSLAVAGTEGTLRLYDAQTGIERETIELAPSL
ncbi:MAG TPA: WD40 repeat domain-containing protein [Planctomycetaceae bacterium]|jgi:WD40 repeat protein